MKVRLLILLLVGTHLTQANEVKFGKVSEQEVAETQHHLEPDADAAILYKKERVFYNYNAEQGWSLTKEAHYRIKIYNKEGFSWATLQIPLYASQGDEEKIANVKGITFNMIDGKIVEEKLKKDGIFVEEVNKYRNKASITMPEVKEGSVLDIEFKVNSPLYWYMDDFRFQYSIPVNRVDLRLDIPQYFVFKRHSKGYYPIQFQQSRESRSINISYRTEDVAGKLGKTSRQSHNLSFYENVYEVQASDLPSMVEEEYTSNINNYRSAIKFELASTQFPNRPYKDYSLTWEGVAKSIYEYESFGTELRRENYYKDEVDQIIDGITDDREKAKLIFEFVQSKMNWNDYYGVTCSRDGIKKAFKEGAGNAAEINLMLTSMFRYAGLNANPILVSTRSNGIPLFPTTDGFNYVIAGMEVLDNVILFDATEKNTIPGVLPNRALNWMGRLVRKDGSSSQVELTPKKLSKEIHYVTATIHEDGSVDGKTRTQYTNQLALELRDKLEKTDEETYLENMENQHGEMEIDGYELKNKEQLEKPMIETCDFVKENQCEIIGQKIYFKPMLFLAESSNPFKMEKREYPVDFSFPRQKKYMISLTIPEGYKVESLPESAVVQLPENSGKFSFKVLSQGNQIRVNATTELNSAFFPVEYYDALKEYYKNLILKQSEKVVLSKV
ncbi:transglutaminase domain-containing protein [Flagellimonas algicola]|uniref:Transglutaminase n=1 Tax=Flagellimonas algicola TaxID=2583815 RepID=A0ABY2WHJ8_9FLAO|nr:transglutaminase domain-containing protein [Allomuricauda algicola]TMU50933.1 transglutaminase [Allomuricauda algicola]